jgi:CTP:molybdopterin cytidylyltransferase MocA
VQRVREALADKTSLAVATYDGRWGHPVGLGARHVQPAAAAARGDEGARSYLRAHADVVHEVECGDVGDPGDLDLPGDLEETARG